MNDAIILLKQAEEKWCDMIEKGKEYREKEILDFYHCKLTNETENDKKKRKKIRNGIIRNQNRMHTFHFLIRHVGKGIKGNAKKLIIKDEDSHNKTLLN